MGRFRWVVGLAIIALLSVSCLPLHNATAMDACRSLLKAAVNGDTMTFGRLNHGSQVTLQTEMWVPQLAEEIRRAGGLENLKYYSFSETAISVSAPIGYSRVFMFRKEGNGYFLIATH